MFFSRTEFAAGILWDATKALSMKNRKQVRRGHTIPALHDEIKCTQVDFRYGPHYTGG